MRLNLPKGIEDINLTLIDQKLDEPITPLVRNGHQWTFLLEVEASEGTTPACDALAYREGVYAGGTRDGHQVKETEVASLCFPDSVRALAMALSTLGTVVRTLLIVEDDCLWGHHGTPVYRLEVTVSSITNRADFLIHNLLDQAIERMAPLGFPRQSSVPTRR